MLEVKTTIGLLNALCECEESESFRCPNCQISEVVEYLSEQLTEYKKSTKALQNKQKIFREGARSAQLTNNRYVEALKFYWHKSNRQCPCLFEVKPGRCKSPWNSIEVIEEAPKLTHEQEIEAIEEFLRKRDGAKAKDN